MICRIGILFNGLRIAGRAHYTGLQSLDVNRDTKHKGFLIIQRNIMGIRIYRPRSSWKDEIIRLKIALLFRII